MKTTAKVVAKWMADEIDKNDILYQQVAVYQIEEQFGRQFVYNNERGASAIDKNVLHEFRMLTEDTVVWERGERSWRKRQRYDEPGRRQH
jgi:hypothetical protein